MTEAGQVESPTIVFDPNAVDNIGKYGLIYDIEVGDLIKHHALKMITAGGLHIK